MIVLDYQSAHTYVESHENVSWNGWDIEIFKSSPRLATRPEGVFRFGEWGQKTTIPPSADGLWRINNEKHIRRTRN